MKVHTIDLHFQGTPENIAAFLIISDEGPVLIETGPHSTLNTLSAGIERHGIKVGDIKHVFLTHIHLDHAGAAWWFAAQGAAVYVHPNGIKHLANPRNLIHSATRIYGNKMDALWGDMLPIHPDKLYQVAHTETISIGQLDIKAWHTPGHANHHIAWQVNQHLFTGDVGGIRIHEGPVVPPCPPPDINIELWKESLSLIRQIQPSFLYLTHFGKHPYKESHLNELSQRLEEWSSWIKPYCENDTRLLKVVPLFLAFTRNSLAEGGTTHEEILKYETANPIWMSVAGLMRYWKKAGD